MTFEQWMESINCEVDESATYSKIKHDMTLAALGVSPKYVSISFVDNRSLPTSDKD